MPCTRVYLSASLVVAARHARAQSRRHDDRVLPGRPERAAIVGALARRVRDALARGDFRPLHPRARSSRPASRPRRASRCSTATSRSPPAATSPGTCTSASVRTPGRRHARPRPSSRPGGAAAAPRSSVIAIAAAGSRSGVSACGTAATSRCSRSSFRTRGSIRRRCIRGGRPIGRVSRRGWSSANGTPALRRRATERRDAAHPSLTARQRAARGRRRTRARAEPMRARLHVGRRGPSEDARQRAARGRMRGARLHVGRRGPSEDARQRAARGRNESMNAVQ